MNAEQNYRERSGLLFKAAMSEQQPDLRLVLLVQSERIAMKALALELERKQSILKAWGIPLHV